MPGLHRGIGALLLLAGLVAAESAPLFAQKTVPHRQFTSFDGLPSENITALAQTPDGLLWIGTETGLAVYDGHDIREVSLPDSLGTTYVSSIRAQSDGSVWVTPSTGEAVQVRHYGVVRVVSLGDRLVQQILQQGSSLLFVTRTAVWRLPSDAATARRQPFRYDIRPTGGGGDAGAGVFAADRGPNGTIWVLDGRLGPGRLHRDGSVSFVGAPIQTPGRFWYDLQFSSAGSGLVLQGEQLHRMDPATGALESVEEDLGDPTYLSVQGRRAYVTRNQTLLRYDVEEDRWLDVLGSEQGLPQQTPVEVLRDQNDGLWVGTKDGLLYLMAPGARQLEMVDGTPLHNVLQFLSAGDELWTRTYGTGLVQLGPSRRQVTPGAMVGWRQPVYSENGRLHVISSETREWYRRAPAGEWTRVGQTVGAIGGVVTEDGIGYFRHNDGLYRHDPTAPATPVLLAKWPSEKTYRHNLALLPNGDLLHRAGGYFLRRRPPDGAVMDTIAVLDEDPDSALRRVVVDPKGRIWGAFQYGGLLRINPATGRQGMILREHRMWGIEAVADSLVLASTRKKGVYLVDTERLSVRRHLTRADGLRSNTAMATHLEDGTLFVGHDNGVTRMSTRHLFEPQHSPPTLLTGLEINLEDRPPTVDSTLTATKRSIGFDYTAPNLAHASQLRYEVRLLPRDTSWASTDRRFTRYTNLEPGTYRFQVRAQLGTQPPGRAAQYAFTVMPHVYETGWFRLLGGVFVLVLCVGAYRWRTYRLRARQRKLEEAVEERTRKLTSRTEELAAEKHKTEMQAARLAELDEAKNRFFAHVSHEFRTPLSLILGPLREALRRGNEAISFGRQQVRRMMSNAERLQHLIDQLLDLATLEAGEMQLDLRGGDVVALVKRTADSFRSKAEDNDIALRVEAQPDWIDTRFDPEKVETIAANLVGNAVKFTPEGGTVTVHVHRSLETSKVRAPGGEEEDSVIGAIRIEVADTGPGIASDVQTRIFDRFAQADASAPRDPDGIGLGLALTHELIGLHGGRIELESSPGEGATFTVWLPLLPGGGDEAADREHASPAGEERGPVAASSSEHRRAPGTTASTHPSSLNGTGRCDEDEEADTILVVEDNAEMRTYLQEELSVHWTVLEAKDGEDGWRSVREKKPDLVLSDVMMPGLDGFALCERIKGEEELRSTPVLLLTARADEEATLEGFACGADDYVSKPFSVGELKGRIANHLAARRHLRREYREEMHIEPLGISTDEEAQPFVEDVIEAIEVRATNPDFTAGQLGEALAMSRRQLTRRLKAAIGETPAAFIRQYRLEWAKKRLQEGAETIAEVAYAVGFRSPSAFSQSFRKAVGVPPSKYPPSSDE